MKKKTKKTKIKKLKVWSYKTADDKFSLYIRERDGKCVRCGRKENLQCSHYWSRQFNGTRFDPENCDTICYPCHYGNQQGWEHKKQGAYRNFKLEQLGEERYVLMEMRSNSTVKKYDAILACMKLLGKLV